MCAFLPVNHAPRRDAGRLGEPGKVWDLLVIGGGATGAGIALDAASRGYAAALVEHGDFGSGTSGRSTKLVNGSVVYYDGQFDDARLLIRLLMAAAAQGAARG
jgi:glycerol-3-phosphate dehydrogenase